MSFDWQRYLVIAQNLSAQAAASTDSEALCRSAVSRAYFGAYCHARNYAKDFLGFDPREDSVVGQFAVLWCGRLACIGAGETPAPQTDPLPKIQTTTVVYVCI